MPTPPSIPGFRPVPFTGVIYVMAEAAQARLSLRPSRLVQPRPGPARDRPAAGRAAARAPRRDRRRRPGVRAGARHLGAARGGRGALQHAVPPRHEVAVQGRERLHLRRRAQLAHARRRGARPGQPRALPARLHGLRGAARHLQALHHASRSCSTRRAATASPPTTSSARCSARASPRCCCPTRTTPPATPSRARSSQRWVATARDAAVHAAARRVLLALHLDRRRRRPRRWSRPRSTSRTWSSDPGGALRRLHQELALPGLALHLGGRTEAGHRRGGEHRQLPRRRRLEAAAARRAAAARARRGAAGDGGASSSAFRQQAEADAQGPRAAGVRFDLASRGHVLLLGRRVGTAGAAQRRAWRS